MYLFLFCHILGFQITVENSKDRIFKDEEYAR